MTFDLRSMQRSRSGSRGSSESASEKMLAWVGGGEDLSNDARIVALGGL